MSNSLLAKAAQIINGTRSMLHPSRKSEVEEWNAAYADYLERGEVEEWNVAYADYLKQEVLGPEVPDPKTIPYESTIVTGMVSDDG